MTKDDCVRALKGNELVFHSGFPYVISAVMTARRSERGADGDFSLVGDAVYKCELIPKFDGGIAVEVLCAEVMTENQNLGVRHDEG